MTSPQSHQDMCPEMFKGEHCMCGKGHEGGHYFPATPEVVKAMAHQVEEGWAEKVREIFTISSVKAWDEHERVVELKLAIVLAKNLLQDQKREMVEKVKAMPGHYFRDARKFLKEDDVLNILQ